MKKKGNLYQATRRIPNIISGGYLGTAVAFYFAKLSRNEYLVVIDGIFRKDPIKRRYSIISAKRFKKLSEGHTLQELNEGK